MDDIGIKLSQKDIIEICLRELREQIEARYQELVDNAEQILKRYERARRSYERELAVAVSERFEPLRKRLLEDLPKSISRSKVRVRCTVHFGCSNFGTDPHAKPPRDARYALGSDGTRDSSDSRRSVNLGFRGRPKHAESARFIIDNISNANRHHDILDIIVPADDLPTVKASGELAEVTKELDAISQELDKLWYEFKRFDKNAADAKHRMMRKVLESNAEGRALLETVRTFLTDYGISTKMLKAAS